MNSGFPSLFGSYVNVISIIIGCKPTKCCWIWGYTTMYSHCRLAERSRHETILVLQKRSTVSKFLPGLLHGVFLSRNDNSNEMKPLFVNLIRLCLFRAQFWYASFSISQIWFAYKSRQPLVISQDIDFTAISGVVMVVLTASQLSRICRLCHINMVYSYRGAMETSKCGQLKTTRGLLHVKYMQRILCILRIKYRGDLASTSGNCILWFP